MGREPGAPSRSLRPSVRRATAAISWGAWAASSEIMKRVPRKHNDPKIIQCIVYSMVDCGKCLRYMVLEIYLFFLFVLLGFFYMSVKP